VTRLLVLVALAVVIWIVLNALLRWLRGALAARIQSQVRGGQRGPAAAPPRTTDRLVPCATCGVRVPAARAIPAGGGRVWCSEACRRQAAAAS
jgi:hypothetical protein